MDTLDQEFKIVKNLLNNLMGYHQDLTMQVKRQQLLLQNYKSKIYIWDSTTTYIKNNNKTNHHKFCILNVC